MILSINTVFVNIYMYLLHPPLVTTNQTRDHRPGNPPIEDHRLPESELSIPAMRGGRGGRAGIPSSDPGHRDKDWNLGHPTACRICLPNGSPTDRSAPRWGDRSKGVGAGAHKVHASMEIGSGGWQEMGT